MQNWRNFQSRDLTGAASYYKATPLASFIPDPIFPCYQPHAGHAERNALLRVAAYIPDCDLRAWQGAKGKTQAGEMSLRVCRVYKKEVGHDAEIVSPASGKLEATTSRVKLR
jgi:hypothetical protein